MEGSVVVAKGTAQVWAELAGSPQRPSVLFHVALCRAGLVVDDVAPRLLRGTYVVLNAGNLVHLVLVTSVSGTVDNVVVGTVTWAERARLAPGHVMGGTTWVGLDLARIVWALKPRSTWSDGHTKPGQPLEVRQSA